MTSVENEPTLLDLVIKDLPRVTQEIRKAGYRIVALQLPEGVKRSGPRIAQAIEQESGAAVIHMGDPCFGACDMVDDEAFNLGCEALVHVGHSHIPNLAATRIPVFYIEMRQTPPSVDLFSELDMDALPQGDVGLFTAIQHMDLLEPLRAYLELKGRTGIIGQGDNRIAYFGQVLGCNFSSPNAVDHMVSSYIYIGTGRFHPLGVHLSTRKPVYCVDPYSGHVTRMADEAERILRRRFAVIQKAKQYDEFGILVSSRKGQMIPDLAIELRDLGRDKGKSLQIIATRLISPESLDAWPYQAFVSTACPRIAIDDQDMYTRKLLLNPTEFKVLLDIIPWEDYSFDQITRTSIPEDEG